MCGKVIRVLSSGVTGYDYKEITVRCGNTSPHGSPWLCDDCEKIHSGRNWRQEARDRGEAWDEDDY